MWRWPPSYLVSGEYLHWGRNWAAEVFFLWANFPFTTGIFRPLHKHNICRVFLDFAWPPRNPSFLCFTVILVLTVDVSLLSLVPLLLPFGSDLIPITMCVPIITGVCTSPDSTWESWVLNIVHWRVKWRLWQLRRGRLESFALGVWDSSASWSPLFEGSP